MIGKPGFDTLVTHLFIEGVRYLESDAVFGVKPQPVVQLEDAEGGWTATGDRIGKHKRLRHDLGLRSATTASD